MMLSKNRAILGAVVLCAVLAAWTAYGMFAQKGHGAHAGAKKSLYYCPMHPTYTSEKPGECPICYMSLVKYGDDDQHTHGSVPAAGEAGRVFTVEEILKMKPGEICLLHKCKMGTCTMAMTEEFARLGKCPHCGEDLGVVIKDLMPEGYQTVILSPEKRQLIGVKTALVEKRNLSKTIRTVGTIAHDPELYQAQAEFIEAVRSAEKAKESGIPEIAEQAGRLVESSRIRLKHLGLSDELINEVAAQAEPDHRLLYSHGGGTVWVYARAYEYELPYFKPGQAVSVENPAIPGKVFSGTVRAIDTMVDQMTRTTRVRAQIEDPEAVLKPDMFVNVEIKMDIGEVIAVPREAVFETGTRKIVFVDKGEGNLEPREVVIGAPADAFYEVKSGLSEGEWAVTSGNFLIDSESRLKGALESMSSGEHQHGG